jgi:hypothetical protein
LQLKIDADIAKDMDKQIFTQPLALATLARYLMRVNRDCGRKKGQCQLAVVLLIGYLHEWNPSDWRDKVGAVITKPLVVTIIQVW